MEGGGSMTVIGVEPADTGCGTSVIQYYSATTNCSGDWIQGYYASGLGPTSESSYCREPQTQLCCPNVNTRGRNWIYAVSNSSTDIPPSQPPPHKPPWLGDCGNCTVARVVDSRCPYEGWQPTVTYCPWYPAYLCDKRTDCVWNQQQLRCDTKPS